ncbi:MAG TPA: F0F1 ATP synthase subunit I [Pseudomonadaceae bacterium]|nr:F0F1 ATP synthase subunit I [Pseudomonadaceae bacterium]
MITFSPVRVTVFQSVVLILLVLGMLLVAGKLAAQSAALGGLVSILPQAWFTRQVFRHSGARSMEKVVRNAYVGELVKLLMMGAGFALIFTLVEPVAAAAVFIGFVVSHLAGLLALARQTAGT